MAQPADEALVEKIRTLSPERLAEVEDFVEFLTAKEQRQQALDLLRALRERLPEGEITDAEVQSVVADVRNDRIDQRNKRERAGRT